MKTQERPLTILSIDGGGVRGIIPARILQVLEEKTGQPIGKLFDVISGTSTGGLVAAGLTASSDGDAPKFSAKDLVNFYKNESGDIFKEPRSTFGCLFRAKYDRANLDKVLNGKFGDLALSRTLSNLVLVSYGLKKELPHLWSGRLARKYCPYKDFFVKDAVAATTAAPVYFAPKDKIYNINGDEVYCEVDGGLYANNPAAIAGIEAVKISPDLNRKNVIFVSLGTGESEQKQWGQVKSSTGLLGWINREIIGKIASIMMKASSDMTDRTICDVFPNYFRLQVTFPKKLPDMDDASPENLQRMLDFTNEYLNNADTKKAIDILAEMLRERKLRDKPYSFAKKIPVYRLDNVDKGCIGCK